MFSALQMTDDESSSEEAPSRNMFQQPAPQHRQAADVDEQSERQSADRARGKDETGRGRQAKAKKIKFKAELVQNRKAKDQANGIDGALQALSLRKKNKKKRARELKNARLKALARSDTDSDESEAGDQEIKAPLDPVTAARARDMVSVSTLDGNPAEDLYVPVLSFADLSQRAQVPDALVHGALVSVSSYQHVAGQSVEDVNLHPSAVQAECWGAMFEMQAGGGTSRMTGRDVVAISHTGSGKTLAFLVPVFACLLASGGEPSDDNADFDGIAAPSALVLAPTRELCLQISDVAEIIGKEVSISVLGVVGGAGFEHQRRQILSTQARVIVATPGRLLAHCGVPKDTDSGSHTTDTDHLTSLVADLAIGDPANDKSSDAGAASPVVSLQRVRALVLDEADRLLDLGFEKDIRMITNLIATRNSSKVGVTQARGQPTNFLNPDVHPQTILTSATWSAHVDNLSRLVIGRQCVKIVVGEQGLSAAASVTQTVEVLKRKGGHRQKRLVSLLRSYLGKSESSDEGGDVPLPAKALNHDSPRILVFVVFKKEAVDVSKLLLAKNIPCGYLHGGLSQLRRQTAMKAFREGEFPVLVATDVAGRGLDVDDVSHVVNYSLGLSVEQYVHRIGRCGRAGRKGFAHTFILDVDKRLTPALVSTLRQANQRVPVDLAELAARAERQAARGGGRVLDDDDDDVEEARRVNREKQKKQTFGHQKGGGKKQGRRR